MELRQVHTVYICLIDINSVHFVDEIILFDQSVCQLDPQWLYWMPLRNLKHRKVFVIVVGDA